MDSRPTSAAGRDPFMPQPPKVRGRAITLAVLAHVLLILAIAFGVNWRSSEPTTVAAELWSATPQAAAPRAVEPPPTPTPEVKKPEPVVKPPAPVAPPKPAPALPDPQIAIEKAKREEAKRAAAEHEQQLKAKRDQAEREKAERAEAERQKRAKDELAQKKAAAEKDKADKAEAAHLAALRDQQMKRIQGMAGATGAQNDTGTALRSSAPSASYAGRIMARIKPNIVFTDVIDGNPMATVEVKLAPDGTIVAKRLVKSSGVKSWDDAVLRAIERTEVLPRDVDGRVPPPFQIDFRPRD
jgi:colicin import membrane protein